ncbi:MAG: KH domain-containing protein [Candidatus Buchananbacteria bacterium]|nr:KH domain-containing protein [Candidatus Buchananbacteria bacterium]
MAEADQKFIEGLVKMLVNNPKKVKVDRMVDEKGVLLTIDVDPEDLGSLVGKQGRNINALRHLARMIGLKNKSFVSIRLNQPEK